MRLSGEGRDGLKEIVLNCHRSFLEGPMPDLARRMRDEDGAEAFFSGSTLWTWMVQRYAPELGVPVLDPAISALRMAEMLVDASRPRDGGG